MMATLSLFSLAVVALLCAIGALHSAYQDNTLQRIGMGCVCLASVGLMDHVWRFGGVSFNCALMSIGLLLFSIGVLDKVIKFNALEKLPHDNEVHP